MAEATLAIDVGQHAGQIAAVGLRITRLPHQGQHLPAKIFEVEQVIEEIDLDPWTMPLTLPQGLRWRFVSHADCLAYGVAGVQLSHQVTL